MNSLQQAGYGYMFWWAVDKIAARPKNAYFVRGSIYSLGEHCLRVKDAFVLLNEKCPYIAEKNGIDMEYYNEMRAKMNDFDGVINFDPDEMDENFPGWNAKKGDNEVDFKPYSWILMRSAVVYYDLYAAFGKKFLQGERSYDYDNVDAVLRDNGYSDVLKVLEDQILNPINPVTVNGEKREGTMQQVFHWLKRNLIEDIQIKGEFYIDKYLNQAKEAKIIQEVNSINLDKNLDRYKQLFEKSKIDEEEWSPILKRYGDLIHSISSLSNDQSLAFVEKRADKLLKIS